MEPAATPLVAKLLYCARAAVVSCDMTSSISNFEGGTHKKKPLLSLLKLYEVKQVSLAPVRMMQAK